MIAATFNPIKPMKLISKLVNYPAHPITVGIAGVAATQTAFAMNAESIQTVADATTTPGDPVTVIIQIVIGIATLWKLLRKKKNEQ